MDALATLAAVTGCALLLWSNWSKFIPPPKPRVPTELLGIDGAALKGNPSAPVVIIEYSDYQCPFCGKAEFEILPELTKEYIDTGKAQLAFRHHPLTQIHPAATKAAEAAVCAGKQGKFWEMHAALFSDQKHLDDSSITARAESIGLEANRFRSCLASDVDVQIRNDSKEAERLGLMGTPAFLIGTRDLGGRVRVVSIVDGARPISDFEKAIDQILDEIATSNTRRGGQ